MRRLCPVFLASLLGCVSAQQQKLQTYNNDGVYLFQRGDYVSARDDFQAALALQPNDPALLYNSGQCCERLGDAKGAEQFYTRCLLAAPNHADCRHAEAALMLRSGRRDETVAFVESWLASQPKLASAYALDGWLWHQLGDLPKAQGRLDQALEIDPHEPHGLVEMARLYETMQRPDRAAALYERALAQDPHQALLVSRLNQLRSQGVGTPHPD